MFICKKKNLTAKIITVNITVFIIVMIDYIIIIIIIIIKLSMLDYQILKYN